ncbi:DEAD/DEAH box helicase [Propionibacterium freudenreichii]|uniref:DEAD/DEAH box helicase n=1 Tax=Propionibacterium freudenreichii TaxID=1744 RepID=UPI0005443A6B|nr:DEAD/DEAH box helicase [Propionibacterium freudenreichii]CEH00577.1 Helicase [Propionibacterium freudenreichii]
MAFLGKTKRTVQQFPSPEELYLSESLPRTTAAVDSLWLHQGDVIRAYAQDHQDTPDLALELPTGTGKTLPGLLIAEWVRRKTAGPVIYATPTKQLAQQVAATAEREGVPVANLTGSAKHWDPADEASVEGSEAIGITTYSAIFNSSPKLPEPRLLIFDDAHAGEQFVGNEYGISIRRYDDENAYLEVVEALKPFLSGLLIQRLEGEPDPGAHHQVRLILPAVDQTALTKLDAALASLPKPHSYKLAMIRSGLAACCVYLSYGGIQIRPMIPPTYENHIYARAKQRIYLSATLGSGGELERAFGRRKIVRMPLPAKTPPRSGRRLFIFPDLVKGGDAIGLTRQIIDLTHKALVLSQDTVSNAEAVAKTLAGDNIPVMGRDDLERQGLESFSDAPTGVLGLANRYDGLDLPGDACRVVVLEGKPDAVGLQERFLSERAEANAALAERLRTRIVQGAGRCTRGPNDYAVVVVLGSDIMKYFSRPENLKALEPELQAEVEFGWQNSKGADPEEVIENVEMFLEHGGDWREQGEPAVAEFRQDAVKVEPPGTDALGKAAALEVEAWQLAFAGDWIGASEKLQKAVPHVGPAATRGYRGLLLYLAGVWLHLGAQDETQRSRARQLVREAALAANRGTWLKEMRDLPGAEDIPLVPEDVAAVNQLVARLRGQLKPKQINDALTEMRAALAQDEATRYERGLTTLGSFLGAEASKPKGQGRCDSAWVWDTTIWMTIEAKSEQHGDGLLPLKSIRQTNTQLDELAADRGMDHPPAGSPSIILSDKLSVDPRDAQTANPNVYLTSPAVVKEIAGDVASFWTNLLMTAVGITSEQAQKDHVTSVMTENGCLPSQVINRLTQGRIRPGD